MRPGRREDLTQLMELWRRDVAAGRQDVTPSEARVRGMLGRFDWEARSRVAEDAGRIVGAALVTSRPSPDGVIATVSLAGAPDGTRDLTRWSVQLSRAAGASIVQLFAAHGARSLEEFGFHVARPWLRMDRGVAGLPHPNSVAGYRLIDGSAAPAGAWGDTFNRSFADHWRFAPRVEQEVVGDKVRQLCLMAISERGEPAAMTLGELETYENDARAQPVGLISSVGTAPAHRRRGLAAWLVAEVLARLKAAGARSASLYVDGHNPMRAFDAYRKLGFEVAFEADVWEATAS